MVIETPKATIVINGRTWNSAQGVVFSLNLRTLSHWRWQRKSASRGGSAVLLSDTEKATGIMRFLRSFAKWRDRKCFVLSFRGTHPSTLADTNAKDQHQTTDKLKARAHSYQTQAQRDANLSSQHREFASELSQTSSSTVARLQSCLQRDGSLRIYEALSTHWSK